MVANKISYLLVRRPYRVSRRALGLATGSLGGPSTLFVARAVTPLWPTATSRGKMHTPTPPRQLCNIFEYNNKFNNIFISVKNVNYYLQLRPWYL